MAGEMPKVHRNLFHTMTREQIAWFKAGSALNAGQPVDLATGGTANPDDLKLEPGDTKAKPGKDV